MLLVFLALGEAVLTSKLVADEREEAARRFDRAGRWLYPVLLVALLVITLKG
ncbi:MAG: hypothetical protein GY719_01535 [bacterium]|nr:hypothetical protein [bacterium]